MATAFALSQPQAIEKCADSRERLRLPCLNLRARPIDAVDLWFRRSQRAEVFVLSGIREFFIQAISLDVSRNFVVPCASLFRCESLANDACAPISDLRNHLRGNRALR